MAQQLEVKYIRTYTEGSVARKLAPAYTLREPEVLPRVHKRKKILVRVDPVAVLGIAVAVTMLICMACGVSTLLAARQETVQMQAYVSALSAENQRLYEAYEQSYELEDVEKTALALGMIPQEQAQHIFIDAAEPVQQQMEQPGFFARIATFLAEMFA